MRRIGLLLLVILIQSSYAAKKSCGTKKGCQKFGKVNGGVGSCQLKKEECDGKRVGGKKYCKSKHCDCCATPKGPKGCETMPPCIKDGGKCQPKKSPCDGTLLKGKPYMKHCKDINNCGCCVPPPPDCAKETLLPCKDLDGTCISQEEKCHGREIINKAFCKSSDSCKCCFPDRAPKPCNVDCEHWCYPSTDWPDTCFNFCNGTKQSPINICNWWSTSYIHIDYLNFSGYSDTIPKITIKNNGHTVSATWDSSLSNKTISGDGLNSEYNLAQFHFHWGCKSDRGSEHTIDGTRYSMELHLVHYKASYGNLKEAIQYPDGLAVIGIFFDVGGIFETMGNNALKPITNNLQDIVEPGSEKEIEFNMPLSNLIPDWRTFYRYKGSLTTPTCNEVVIWSVYEEPQSFSEEQAQSFRKLMDKEGNMLCDNYRGTQPVNGRRMEMYLF